MLKRFSSLPPILLASSSPQRKDLLFQAGFEVLTASVPYEEDHSLGDDPRDLVRILCRHKMEHALSYISQALLDSHIVVCSDTMVALGNQRLGKPADKNQAAAYLSALSGTTHEVITGISMHIPPALGKPPGLDAFFYQDSVSHVTFKPLAESDLSWYLDSGEWAGAAGGYRIQGKAACLIRSITGSYTGVIGFPLDLFFDMLTDILKSICKMEHSLASKY